MTSPNYQGASGAAGAASPQSPHPPRIAAGREARAGLVGWRPAGLARTSAHPTALTRNECVCIVFDCSSALSRCSDYRGKSGRHMKFGRERSHAGRGGHARYVVRACMLGRACMSCICNRQWRICFGKGVFTRLSAIVRRISISRPDR
jgi:hypothetical protein